MDGEVFTGSACGHKGAPLIGVGQSLGGELVDGVNDAAIVSQQNHPHYFLVVGWELKGALGFRLGLGFRIGVKVGITLVLEHGVVLFHG